MNDTRNDEQDLDAAAAEVRALAGVTDDDPALQRRRLIRNAAKDCKHCAGCGRDLRPEEPVWRYHVAVDRLFGAESRAFAPHCEQCRNPDWWFSKPRPCEGCGRPVHLPQWGRWRYRHLTYLCCENCTKVRRDRLKAAIRAEVRGTRVCETCSKTFVPARTDARFCSVACKQRAYRTRQRSR
jgi:hypothetical protein